MHYCFALALANSPVILTFHNKLLQYRKQVIAVSWSFRIPYEGVCFKKQSRSHLDF